MWVKNKIKSLIVSTEADFESYCTSLELPSVASFLNMPDKIRKRQSEAIRRKKKTVIENIHKLGQFPGIDVAFIVRQNGQYTFYQSVNLADFPPSKEQIVSKFPRFR